MQKPQVFFDGNCPLCRKEIGHYQRLDKARRIHWLDLHQAAPMLADHGISKRQAMQILHVADQQGTLHRGAPAFIIIWDNLPGYRHLASAVRLLRLETVMQSVYLRFARWRFARRCRTGCSAEQ